MTDRQGIPIAMSSAKTANHHDLHEIENSMTEIFNTMKQAEISLDGLFINADAGFDSKEFRTVYDSNGIIATYASIIVMKIPKMNFSLMNCFI